MITVRRRSTRLLAAAFVISSGAWCGGAQAQAPETTPEGLQKVEGATVDLAYVKSGTQWAKYKTAQVAPLVVPISARATRGGGDNIALRSDDIAALQKLYAEAMRAQLQRNGYVLVDAPRADTFIVSAEITDIVSNRSIVRGAMATTAPNGSITIQAKLTDGTTRTVVATAADRRYAHHMWGGDSRETNLRQIREAFDNWARVLSDAIKARAATSKDPIECPKTARAVRPSALTHRQGAPPADRSVGGETCQNP